MQLFEQGKLDLTPGERLLRLGVRVIFLLDLIFIASLLGLLTYGLSHLESSAVKAPSGSTWSRSSAS